MAKKPNKTYWGNQKVDWKHRSQGQKNTGRLGRMHVQPRAPEGDTPVDPYVPPLTFRLGEIKWHS